ncbi:hypothetical protein [Psychrobacter sp. 72-O-c]|uniref:hypothetical protein n=1 Tax=Psychrobacter sp. 72-O-c TaxID=2774125 RepID=UPI00191B09B0|nr:hypothetical protein [Psychrobacter sp. 72-O-c]
MQIEYIKNAPNGPKGMIDNVTGFEANVLIKSGFAKAYEPTEPKARSKSKPKAATKTEDE